MNKFLKDFIEGFCMVFPLAAIAGWGLGTLAGLYGAGEAYNWYSRADLDENWSKHPIDIMDMGDWDRMHTEQESMYGGTDYNLSPFGWSDNSIVRMFSNRGNRHLWQQNDDNLKGAFNLATKVGNPVFPEAVDLAQRVYDTYARDGFFSLGDSSDIDFWGMYADPKYDKYTDAPIKHAHWLSDYIDDVGLIQALANSEDPNLSSQWIPRSRHLEHMGNGDASKRDREVFRIMLQELQKFKAANPEVVKDLRSKAAKPRPNDTGGSVKQGNPFKGFAQSIVEG